MNTPTSQQSSPWESGDIPMILSTSPEGCTIRFHKAPLNFDSDLPGSKIKETGESDEQQSPPPSASLSLTEITTTIRVKNHGESSDWTAWSVNIESELRNELASYADLGDNWDEEGAKAPTQRAVNDALCFLNRKPAGIPFPYPEVGAGGEVGVYWEDRKTRIFAEVNFEGDGTYAYFAVHGTPDAVESKCGEDGLDVTRDWPEDLKQILRLKQSI